MKTIHFIIFILLVMKLPSISYSQTGNNNAIPIVIQTLSTKLDNTLGKNSRKKFQQFLEKHDYQSKKPIHIQIQFLKGLDPAQRVEKKVNNYFYYNVEYYTPEYKATIFDADNSIVFQKKYGREKVDADFGVDESFSVSNELSKFWGLQKKVFYKKIEEDAHNQISAFLKDFENSFLEDPIVQNTTPPIVESTSSDLNITSKGKMKQSADHQPKVKPEITRDSDSNKNKRPISSNNSIESEQEKEKKDLIDFDPNTHKLEVSILTYFPSSTKSNITLTRNKDLIFNVNLKKSTVAHTLKSILYRNGEFTICQVDDRMRGAEMTIVSKDGEVKRNFNIDWKFPERARIITYPPSMTIDEKENIYLIHDGTNPTTGKWENFFTKYDNKGKVIWQRVANEANGKKFIETLRPIKNGTLATYEMKGTAKVVGVFDSEDEPRIKYGIGGKNPELTNSARVKAFGKGYLDERLYTVDGEKIY